MTQSKPKTNENRLENRLTKIESTLEEIKEFMKKISKEVDMTQKIIHVETATNAIRTEQELKKKFSELHNENLTKLDYIVGELQNLRDENTIGAHHTTEIFDIIKNLEKRVHSLEKIQTTS